MQQNLVLLNIVPASKDRLSEIYWCWASDVESGLSAYVLVILCIVFI